MKADTGELKEWVLRSKRGDLSAFEELVRLHQPMVRQLAYRFSGNAADAADLAQEAFVRAWQNIGTQREDAPFGAWLRRVTVNVCLQWRRDRRDGAPLNELHLHMQHDAAGEGEKDGEIAARVNEAVQALPPKLRAAIMLTVYEELNHAEAAAAMGCAETTVSWRVFMARRRLKRALSRLLNNPPNPDGQ